MVKRNDPCPCGSGKKYKKCCMKRNNKKNSFDDVNIDYNKFKEPFREYLKDFINYYKRPAQKLKIDWLDSEEDSDIFGELTPREIYDLINKYFEDSFVNQMKVREQESNFFFSKYDKLVDYINDHQKTVQRKTALKDEVEIFLDCKEIFAFVLIKIAKIILSDGEVDKIGELNYENAMKILFNINGEFIKLLNDLTSEDIYHIPSLDCIKIINNDEFQLTTKSSSIYTIVDLADAKLRLLFITIIILLIFVFIPQDHEYQHNKGKFDKFMNGFVSLFNDNFEESLKYFEKILEKDRRERNMEDVVEELTILALIFQQMNELKRALDCLEEALRISIACGFHELTERIEFMLFGQFK